MGRVRGFRRWIARCTNIVQGSAQARATDTGVEMGRQVASAGLAGLVVSVLCRGGASRDGGTSWTDGGLSPPLTPPLKQNRLGTVRGYIFGALGNMIR